RCLTCSNVAAGVQHSAGQLSCPKKS
ncbi:hypothetical protein BMAFMH_C1300, partial [Burkholderia mallei FMH]